MGFFLILVVFFEVLMGVVVDRVLKKLSVFFFEGFFVFYVIVLYLVSFFFMVFVFMIIVVLVMVFRIGVEIVWVYELFSRDGRVNDYFRVYGRLRVFELVGGFVGMIIGGMLVEIFGMRFVVLMSVLFFLLLLVFMVIIFVDMVKSRIFYMFYIFESIDFV